MRITDLLDRRSISLTGAPASKQETLDQMVDLMIRSEKINDREAYRQEVYRREEESTTGIGEDIAIPHGKGPFVDRPGLAFITEGAIPFAASDPLHVLPSCMVGSAVAGALSMAFGCTLMAPHGGIFVVPVVGNALMYLAALIIGTLVGAVLLGTFQKKISA